MEYFYMDRSTYLPPEKQEKILVYMLTAVF